MIYYITGAKHNGKSYKAETIAKINDKSTNVLHNEVKVIYQNENEHYFKQRLGESEIDYSPYFVYSFMTVDETEWAMITEVKYQAWFDEFGNYDIVIPAKLKGKPTMLKAV